MPKIAHFEFGGPHWKTVNCNLLKKLIYSISQNRVSNTILGSETKCLLFFGSGSWAFRTHVGHNMYSETLRVFIDQI